jgi:hypothetical protein
MGEGGATTNHPIIHDLWDSFSAWVYSGTQTSEVFEIDGTQTIQALARHYVKSSN